MKGYGECLPSLDLGLAGTFLLDPIRTALEVPVAAARLRPFWRAAPIAVVAGTATLRAVAFVYTCAPVGTQTTVSWHPGLQVPAGSWAKRWRWVAAPR